MRVAVTGAAGFLGSWTVEALLSAGHEVTGFDNYDSGTPLNLKGALRHPHFHMITGDVRDLGDCSVAFNQCDVVIHLAEMAFWHGPSLSLDDIHAVNVTGTLNVASAARHREVKRMIYASSCAVYGECICAEETHPFAPVDLYGVTKAAGELYVPMAGCPWFALRFFNVYGPRQDNSGKRKSLIPQWIEAVRRGDAPVINAGVSARDYVFVEDAVRAILLCLDANPHASGAYNIATGYCAPVSMVHAHIHKAFDRQAVQIKAPHTRNLAEPNHICANPLKAQTYLGFTADIDLAEGIERTVNAS